MQPAVAATLRLDTVISFVFVSPNMHKIHHSRDWPVTDHNYSNIFSIWDRLFATFVASKHGREINYGLADHDGDAQQSIAGLLIGPFRARVTASIFDLQYRTVPRRTRSSHRAR